MTNICSRRDKDKDQLIEKINICTNTPELCRVLGLDQCESTEEVTSKRREFSLMIHPDKNRQKEEAANSAFIWMQKACDFILSSVSQQHLKKTNTHVKAQHQSTRFYQRKGHKTKQEVPSYDFSRSESSKKRKFTPPTEREFDDLVHDIDVRVFLWRTFIKLDSASSNSTSVYDNDVVDSQSIEKEVKSTTPCGSSCGDGEDDVKQALSNTNDVFVCLLCRRQFMSKAHLSRHITSSKLHAMHVNMST